MAGISNPATSGTGNVSEALVNVTTAPVAVPYTYTLTGGDCTNAEIVTVTVNPIPTLSGSTTPPAICDSSVFNYVPASLTPGATFTWARTAVAGILNSAASGIGDAIEVLINSTSLPVAVTYLYTVAAGGCAATRAVSVTINPTPRLSSAAMLALCDTDFFDYAATTSTPGATFAWSRPAVIGISTPASFGVTSSISELLTDISGGPVAVIYYFRLGIDGCTNLATESVTVIVDSCLPALNTVTKADHQPFKIFPIPTTGKVTISGIAQGYLLSIYNIIGQKIISYEIAGDGENIIDLSNQPAGVYFIVAVNENDNIKIRVVRE